MKKLKLSSSDTYQISIYLIKLIVMKNSFLLLCIIYFAIIITGLSCSKSSNTTAPPKLETTLKFNANGNFYQWNGSIGDNPGCFVCGSAIYKHTNSSYVLSSSDPAIYYNFIVLKIKATTLSASTYTLTITSTTPASNAAHIFSIFNLLQAASTEAGDFGTVTITSIHDGNYADGTFNARLTLSPFGFSGKMDITNGEFHNIKII